MEKVMYLLQAVLANEVEPSDILSIGVFSSVEKANEYFNENCAKDGMFSKIYMCEVDTGNMVPVAGTWSYENQQTYHFLTGKDAA